MTEDIAVRMSERASFMFDYEPTDYQFSALDQAMNIEALTDT
jgi:hypothetical protein